MVKHIILSKYNMCKGGLNVMDIERIQRAFPHHLRASAKHSGGYTDVQGTTFALFGRYNMYTLETTNLKARILYSNGMGQI